MVQLGQSGVVSAAISPDGRLLPTGGLNGGIFLCGTSTFMWPVATVDDKPIGAEAPGPVTRRLRERLEKICAGRDPALERWLTYVE